MKREVIQTMQHDMSRVSLCIFFIDVIYIVFLDTYTILDMYSLHKQMNQYNQCTWCFFIDGLFYSYHNVWLISTYKMLLTCVKGSQV